jgi:hypothetical protein
VQRGIAGVRLGMTETEVTHTVGLPRRVERGATEIGRRNTWLYPTHSVTFFAGKRVTQMRKRPPNERTAAGIGVGSTRPLRSLALAACEDPSGASRHGGRHGLLCRARESPCASPRTTRHRSRRLLGAAIPTRQTISLVFAPLRRRPSGSRGQRSFVAAAAIRLDQSLTRRRAARFEPVLRG